MLFDTVDDWLDRYGSAGLVDLQMKTGPFEMMTARGFISDEGIANSARVMARRDDQRDCAPPDDLVGAPDLKGSSVPRLRTHLRPPSVT